MTADAMQPKKMRPIQQDHHSSEFHHMSHDDLKGIENLDWVLARSTEGTGAAATDDVVSVTWLTADAADEFTCWLSLMCEIFFSSMLDPTSTEDLLVTGIL